MIISVKDYNLQIKFPIFKHFFTAVLIFYFITLISGNVGFIILYHCCNYFMINCFTGLKLDFPPQKSI